MEQRLTSLCVLGVTRSARTGNWVITVTQLEPHTCLTIPQLLPLPFLWLFGVRFHTKNVSCFGFFNPLTTLTLPFLTTKEIAFYDVVLIGWGIFFNQNQT